MIWKSLRKTCYVVLCNWESVKQWETNFSNSFFLSTFWHLTRSQDAKFSSSKLSFPCDVTSFSSFVWWEIVRLFFRHSRFCYLLAKTNVEAFNWFERNFEFLPHFSINYFLPKKLQFIWLKPNNLLLQWAICVATYLS